MCTHSRANPLLQTAKQFLRRWGQSGVEPQAAARTLLRDAGMDEEHELAAAAAALLGQAVGAAQKGGKAVLVAEKKAALEALLRGLAAQEGRPLLLAVEDCEHCDTTSLALGRNRDTVVARGGAGGLSSCSELSGRTIKHARAFKRA